MAPWTPSAVPASSPSPEELQTARRIKWLRQEAGDQEGAVEACVEAASAFPNNSFFAVLAADLFLGSAKPDEAAKWMVEALRRWEPGNPHFSKFATNVYRLERMLGPAEAGRFRSDLSAVAQARPSSDAARGQVERLLGLASEAGDATWSAPARELAAKLDRRAPLPEVARVAEAVRKARVVGELEAVLDKHLLKRQRRQADAGVDVHFLAAYEEMGRLDKALTVAESLVQVSARPTHVGSLLRLCRKAEDYSRADELFRQRPELLGFREFNLLYELVYYYEAKDDLEKAKAVLARMESGFLESQPIQNAVRNFYLRLGFLNDAQRVDSTLAQKGRPEFAKKAAEAGKEGYEHLLHQQQLAAISELTRGISHELGQPITNVRYTVQFYRKEFEREMPREKVLEVFDVILQQTERMGDLVKRLSPLTSSRRVYGRFDSVERIRNILGAVRPRLEMNQIAASLFPTAPIWVEGDAGHFDQIASNLIVNAIDALSERHPAPGRRLSIDLKELGQSVQITFEDNGPGFPAAGRRLLFNPFYTTKPPGKGEGLGLFIVWNLLKMQGGTISLDSNYAGGVRFCVTIRKNSMPAERDEL